MAIYNADWLSQFNSTGLRLVTPSSSNKRTTQATSAAAAAMARYSASADDLETVCCFLDFQVTGELPNNNTYPVTDLRESTQDAQSASENACSFNDLQLAKEFLE